MLIFKNQLNKIVGSSVRWGAYCWCNSVPHDRYPHLSITMNIFITQQGETSGGNKWCKWAEVEKRKGREIAKVNRTCVVICFVHLRQHVNHHWLLNGDVKWRAPQCECYIWMQTAVITSLQKEKEWPQNRENSWQTQSLWFSSFILKQLLRKPKSLKGSRLQMQCYNGWWLIEMAPLNCIMSVRWWDHDQSKETRQGLIFHSGELITSSHIIYCSS